MKYNKNLVALILPVTSVKFGGSEFCSNTLQSTNFEKITPSLQILSI